MATNLALDDRLINKVVRLGNFRSKKDAVNAAMDEYVKRRSQAAILEMAGKVEYYPDYDYKKARMGKQK